MPVFTQRAFTLPLATLAFVTASSALADTTFDCQIRERRGEALDPTVKRVRIGYTVEVTSKGIRVWIEDEEKPRFYPEIQRWTNPRFSDLVGSVDFEIENDDFGRTTSTESIRFQTSTPQTIDQLPPGTQVNTHITYSGYSPFELIPVQYRSDFGSCTVR